MCRTLGNSLVVTSDLTVTAISRIHFWRSKEIKALRSDERSWQSGVCCPAYLTLTQGVGCLNLAWMLCCATTGA